MARPTQKEIDEWNARMAEPEEDSDDDFEVVLFNAEGQPVGTMPYSRAKAHFKKHGIDLDDPADIPGNDAVVPNGSTGGIQDQGNSAQTARRPRTTQKYFGGKGGTVQPMAPGGPDGGIAPDGGQSR